MEKQINDSKSEYTTPRIKVWDIQPNMVDTSRENPIDMGDGGDTDD